MRLGLHNASCCQTLWTGNNFSSGQQRNLTLRRSTRAGDKQQLSNHLDFQNHVSQPKQRRRNTRKPTNLWKPCAENSDQRQHLTLRNRRALLAPSTDEAVGFATAACNKDTLHPSAGIGLRRKPSQRTKHSSKHAQLFRWKWSSAYLSRVAGLSFHSSQSCANHEFDHATTPTSCPAVTLRSLVSACFHFCPQHSLELYFIATSLMTASVTSRHRNSAKLFSTISVYHWSLVLFLGRHKTSR